MARSVSVPPQAWCSCCCDVCCDVCCDCAVTVTVTMTMTVLSVAGLVLVLDAVVLAWRGGCSVDETAASRLRGAATLAGFAMAVMHAVLCVRLSYMGYNMVVLPWNMAYGVLALQLQVSRRAANRS